MKVTHVTVDVSEEKRVLSHMITSTPLLARLKGIAEPQLFESSYARVVAGWIWEYYELTSVAPERGMQDIYQRKLVDLDEDLRDLIATFLTNLSQEWERATPNNVDFSFEEDLHYFKVQSLKKLKDGVISAINDGDTARGEQLVGEYQRPEKHLGQAINILKDSKVIHRAFTNTDEAVLELGGPVGKLIGPLCREDFIAFQAPPKRGKTWWLEWLAWRTMLAGKKSIFFSFEMSQDQMVRRFWQMITGCSRFGEDAPITRFEPHGDKYELVTYEKESTNAVITDLGVIQREQNKIWITSRGGELRLENYPMHSMSVPELNTRLRNLTLYDNYTPDMVVADYADIMKHTGQDPRDKLNNTWMGLRGMASSLKCVVATASQSSGRDSLLGKKDADESNIAEDYRKLAHVTKLVNINQNQDERKRGIYRLSSNTQREGECLDDTVLCTSRLAIGRPLLDAHFMNEIWTTEV